MSYIIYCLLLILIKIYSLGYIHGSFYRSKDVGGRWDLAFDVTPTHQMWDRHLLNLPLDPLRGEEEFSTRSDSKYVNTLEVQRLFYQFEHARHFLTSITVSKMLVTDNFKEKMFKDQNAWNTTRVASCGKLLIIWQCEILWDIWQLKPINDPWV